MEYFTNNGIFAFFPGKTTANMGGAALNRKRSREDYASCLPEGADIVLGALLVIVCMFSLYYVL